MSAFIKYINMTMAELRQVAWPSQRQTIMYTILVIVVSTIVALYVGAFDYLFSQGINAIISKI
jgi:preprotein translocase subunit SecE